jgi:hypothetical protein
MRRRQAYRLQAAILMEAKRVIDAEPSPNQNVVAGVLTSLATILNDLLEVKDFFDNE